MFLEHPLKHLVLTHYATRHDLIHSLIVELGSYQVRCDRNGQVRGTCPIHFGSDPKNFVVWADRGYPIWKCWSHQCGAGPLHTLVMKKRGINEDQALKIMAQRAGLQFDGEKVTISPEFLDEAETRAFNRYMPQEEVPNYFPDWMLAQSLQQQSYFYNRNPSPIKNFPQEVLNKFQIGYVPAHTWWWPETDPKTQQQHMVGWRDNRISIPVRDFDGNLVGFYGRHETTEKHMKYLMLPSPTPCRRVTLYGIHFPETQAAIKQKKEVIMVEGFSDVWRAHQHHCYNVVAPMGTHLTTRQIEMLGSMTIRQVIMYYDSDQGGQDAVAALAKEMTSRFQVRNALGPPGADPADALTPDDFYRPILTSSQLFLGVSQ